MNLGGDKQLICDDGASVGTLSRVYVAYMQANPKMMDEYESHGLFMAFAVAYPCKSVPAEKPSKN
jgi:hypothetical protein